ncbi:MAG: hypothetical protein DRO88_14100 [Promethearchaeia archaeon]|nr:MAG: hypothetical protein DRO88_14100 [Candidatus Lokiarchaeia archaeon]
MSLERIILIIVPAIFLIAFIFLIFIQNKRNVLSNKVIETGTLVFLAILNAVAWIFYGGIIFILCFGCYIGEIFLLTRLKIKIGLNIIAVITSIGRTIYAIFFWNPSGAFRPYYDLYNHIISGLCIFITIFLVIFQIKQSKATE